MAEDNKKGGLDRRQRDIKVGAGLEESRYNVEFIDFLRRWGSTVMLVLAAAAMAFWGIQRWKENREAKAGVAFGDVDAAMTSGGNGAMDVNPEVLVRIAEDNEGQGAVSVMARLAAAEQWRLSAMKGYKHGALNLQTGKVNNQDDTLTPAGRLEYLEKARQQYQLVVDQTSGSKAKATFTLSGLMGLAAVAETTGKAEEAKAAYKRAQELAEAASFPEFAALAKSRLETADKFSAPTILLPEAMVMSWDKPAPVAPAPAPLPSPLLPDPTTGSFLGPSALTGDYGAGGIPTTIIPTPSTPPIGTPAPATTPPAPATNPTTDPNKPVAPTPTPAPEKKDEPKKP
jgi:hypothetical protein